MLTFALGTAPPLAASGLRSREALLRWHLMMERARAKASFAIVLVVIVVLVFTGLDKHIKTALVDQSPQSLIDLKARFWP